MGFLAPAPPDRMRRAAALVSRALAHEDAEADGIYADRVLADPAVALALLGSPDADPAVRDGVVQRFGLIGALLVVGHEDRWRQHLAVLSGAGDASRSGAETSPHVERLVRQFPHLDVDGLQALLAEIDREEAADAGDSLSDARHRLHAAYAVAARDGNDVSHHEYMASLNQVLRMTRPSVAS